MDAAVTRECVLVMQDVRSPAAAGTLATSSSSSNSSSNSGAGVGGGGELLVVAGTWLDASDPLLHKLPPGTIDDRCGPGLVVAAAYFCSFTVLCALTLVNFVIGGGPAGVGGVAYERARPIVPGCRPAPARRAAAADSFSVNRPSRSRSHH